MNRRKVGRKKSSTPRVVGVDAGKGAASKAQIARGRIVTLAAKPGEVELNLAKTAVVVMDMQNDFGSKDGMFDRAGFDISIVQRTVPLKQMCLLPREARASKSFTSRCDSDPTCPTWERRIRPADYSQSRHSRMGIDSGRPESK